MGVWPGRAFLRLDRQGFFVKAPTKSWGATWHEVERFRSRPGSWAGTTR